jgi:hypothetical protein
VRPFAFAKGFAEGRKAELEQQFADKLEHNLPERAQNEFEHESDLP